MSGHGQKGEKEEANEESEYLEDEHEGQGDEGHGDDGHEGGGHAGHDNGGHGAGHGGSESHAEHNAQSSGKKYGKPKKKTIGEAEIVILLLAAVIGRVLIKQFPTLTSIEPIIPVAVFAGLSYGVNAGVLIGLLAYPLSNIFLEGGPFGLYSLLQGIGGAIAGSLAGYARKADTGTLVLYTVIGTLIFEVILNFGDGLLLVWPFSFTHIISNIFFALLIGELSLKQK